MKDHAFVSPLPVGRTARSLTATTTVRSSVATRQRVHRSYATAVVSLDQENIRTTFEAVSPSRLENVDGLRFLERVDHLVNSRQIPSHVIENLKSWHQSYAVAARQNPFLGEDPDEFTEAMFSTLLELCRRTIADPFDFSSYHQRIRHPFDHYKFGFDFSSVLLDRSKSAILGDENIHQAQNFVRQGHNVIFFSNHQSEGDPYAIDFMLDWIAGCDRQFCEKLVFMAGDRVRNDPMVAPFSAGRNLLTVYSKKHINDEPELFEKKLRHNRKTVSETHRLFKKGGTALWFAPSGGRDRRSAETGAVEISPFDEGAVATMKFTAERSGTPCHFYPMAVWTYDMLPPPSTVGGAEIGEERVAKYTPMRMYVGKEIEWNQSVPSNVKDKHKRRKAQCTHVENLVLDGYRRIGGYEH
ncbi:glycerol-3-phosphate acyltransferase [Gracilaria domingensis]|nr:glycerol-3-phosphate acyltransferase [Gracilaria domingensis]